MIDTSATLRFLAKSAPGIIEDLSLHGIDNSSKLAALASWLLSAAVFDTPEIVDDLEQLANTLQAAYEASARAFNGSNPGVIEAVKEAGSLLVLCPLAVPEGGQSSTSQPN